MGVSYRVRQFVAAVLRTEDPALDAATAAILSPAERALFRRLSPPYRRHSLAVYRRLRRAGHEDTDLLKAALLHDVGKAEGQIQLHHRVLGVLLRNLALPVLLWLAREGTRGGWRYPFYVQRHHAAISARLAEAAGASAAVVALIAHHHDSPAWGEGEAQRALRAADGAE